MRLIYIFLLISLVSAEVIDTIVATVDNNPILLSELNKEANLKITSTAQIKNSEAEKVIEQLITTKLLELESARLNLKVDDNEIKNYINEIKSKNNLTEEDFINELKKQNLTLENYQSQIKLEYLRSRIASSIARKGKAVSNKDIDTYLETHPEINKEGKKLLISQIVVNKKNRDYQTAKALIYGIYDSLLTTDFKKQVINFSEAPDAKLGGSLGIIVQDDLSEEIKYKLEYLNIGEFSAPLEDQETFRIFKIEGIIETDEELREQVQNILNQQNLGVNIEDYFKKDIYKFHSIERKF